MINLISAQIYNLARECYLLRVFISLQKNKRWRGLRGVENLPWTHSLEQVIAMGSMEVHITGGYAHYPCGCLAGGHPPCWAVNSDLGCSSCLPLWLLWHEGDSVLPAPSWPSKNDGKKRQEREKLGNDFQMRNSYTSMVLSGEAVTKGVDNSNLRTCEIHGEVKKELFFNPRNRCCYWN